MRKIFWLLAGFTLCMSCSSDGSADEVEPLEVITDLIYFEYTSDTGNNSSRLEYQFKFTNPNNFQVIGGAQITINTDGLETTTIGTNSSPCYMIDANSECIYTFEAESSHDLGFADSVEFVSAYYNIVDY